MKEKKEDKILRALFKKNLENVEVIPSSAVRTKLMRRLRRKEFLHFNPAKFNIWYSGVLIIAGTALALILLSGSEKNNKSIRESMPGNIFNSPNREDIQSSTEKATNVTIPIVKAGEEKKVNITSAISSETKSPELGKVIPVQKTIADTTTIRMKSQPMQSNLPDPVMEKGKFQGIVKMSDYSIESSVNQGCVPLKVHFKTVNTLVDSCQWNFGDGGYSVSKTPDWLFDNPGEYKVTLQVYGSTGLQSVNVTDVKVFPKPLARFEISPENAVLPDDEITFHNFSINAVKANWNFGDGSSSGLSEPKHKYKNYGNYNIRLIVTSENGCSDSVTIRNAFSGSENFIDFPNAFIPNQGGQSSGYYSQKSDESSQVFHPVFNGVTEYQLRIFSRRGILLFESNDINIGWDGYFKGQLSEPGVYVWKVRGSFINGEPFTKMGDVILIKN